MNICVTVNSLYMKYLYIMLQSLYENNEDGSITLYVLQKDFTNDDKNEIIELTNKYNNKVEFIWVDPNKFSELPDTFKTKSNLSVEILFRLLIPELLPSYVDRVLLLDVDIVVNKDISEMYYTNLDDYLFAAVPNIGANCEVLPVFRNWYNPDRTHWTHFNTGVLLWNLDKIRNEYPYEYIFNSAKRHQDILKPQFEEELFNVEFGEFLIKPLSEEWNYQSRVLVIKRNNPKYCIYDTLEMLKENCNIIHYVDTNPWNFGVKDISYQFWWEYCKKTKFYYEILENVYFTTEKNILSDDVLIKCIKDKKGMKKTIFPKDVVESKDNVILYGAGKIGKIFMNQNMNGRFCNIIDWVDNNYINIGFPVNSPSDISNKEYDKVLIAIESQVIADEIKAQLIEQNIPSEKIVWKYPHIFKG